MPVINNTVPYTEKSVKRVDFKLNVLTIPKKGGRRKLLEVVDRLLVSWVYAYVHTHQIEYIKYGQFFLYPLHLSKAVKNYINNTNK